MGQLQHVQEIAFSTAFLTDKVCGIYTGSIAGGSMTTLAAIGFGNTLYQFIIPHTLTRPCLCDTLVSTDLGVTYTPIGAITYSDASNLYLTVTDNSKFYLYKIVCTWIDNYDTTNPLISPQFQTNNSAAYFDTRYNYQKILESPTTTLSNPGTGNTGTQPIKHGLGYLPLYRLYFESKPGQVWPSVAGGAQDPWLYDTVGQFELSATVDTTNLNLTFNGGSGSPSTFRVWTRIFLDA